MKELSYYTGKPILVKQVPPNSQVQILGRLEANEEAFPVLSIGGPVHIDNIFA
jgi:hypothetical protein